MNVIEENLQIKTDSPNGSFEGEPVLLFDGVCNLCHSAVQFVLRHEKSPTLRFASLQSDVAKKMIEEAGITEDWGKTVILVESGKAYTRSKAAFRLLKHLKGWPRAIVVFRIFPSLLCDLVYNFISQYRYGWFGKKESCPIPRPSQMGRFIDQ